GLWAPIGIDITYISLPNLCWWPYTPICYPDGPYYASFGNCGQWGVPEKLYLTPGPDFKEQAIRRGT
ncbi:MAG: hypothetical protein GTO63_22305, partial [Anaerolineae bacterium]|nr:hypothetical protein [Anaerolineae bacterium]NIN97514.1 hypothetical protein [Anaerolineae bacterium]NIQ80444.1 hypothetical protein [Anaerolineae bacterium]